MSTTKDKHAHVTRTGSGWRVRLCDGAAVRERHYAAHQRESLWEAVDDLAEDGYTVEYEDRVSYGVIRTPGGRDDD